jgi:uncharacterized membrane protein HdeD (DUF308 family)
MAQAAEGGGYAGPGPPLLFAGGGVAMLFGLLAFFQPHVGLVVFLGLFAVGAAIHGASMLARAMRNEAQRWADGVAGAADLMAALAVVARAHLGATSLVWIVGLWAVVRSLTAIAQGLSLGRPAERRWPLVAMGAVGLGFGLMVATQWETGGGALTRLIGGWAFFLGAAAVGVALNLRSVARRGRDDPPHGAAANKPPPPDE